MQCPHCGLLNPDTAVRCDCGWDFPSGTLKRSYLDAPAQHRNVVWDAWTSVSSWFIRHLLGISDESPPPFSPFQPFPIDADLSGRGDLHVICPKCAALLVARRECVHNVRHCLGCNGELHPQSGVRWTDRPRNDAERELLEHLRSVRLSWHGGYFSEYPDALDADVAVVSLSADVEKLVAHHGIGSLSHFKKSPGTDDDGYVVYRESPAGEEREWQPVGPYRALLPDQETFSYRFVLPAGVRDLLEAGTGHRIDLAPARVARASLLGPAATLHFENAGVLKGGGRVSPFCDDIRPSVLATRLVVSARDRSDAAAAAASFHVDQELAAVLKAGDDVHVARTPRGGVAFSAIRGGRLLIALGAVSAVPLGEDLRVTLQRDRVWRTPERWRHDCSKSPPGLIRVPPGPWVHPLQVTSRDRVPRKPRDYEIRCWCGARPAPEDTDECLSIIRAGVCPPVSANASGQLFAVDDALRVEPWPAGIAAP